MLQAPPLPCPSPMSPGQPSAPGKLWEGAGCLGKEPGLVINCPHEEFSHLDGGEKN